jgi:hypothetical protein
LYVERIVDDSEKPLFYLCQFSKILAAKSDILVSISPNVSENDLNACYQDLSAYSAKSPCPLADQELEISGVVIA